MTKIRLHPMKLALKTKSGITSWTITLWTRMCRPTSTKLNGPSSASVWMGVCRGRVPATVGITSCSTQRTWWNYAPKQAKWLHAKPEPQTASTRSSSLASVTLYVAAARIPARIISWLHKRNSSVSSLRSDVFRKKIWWCGVSSH